MAYFIYRAKSPDGQIFKGDVEAASQNEAIGNLRRRNLLILELRVRSKTDLLSFFKRRISLKEKIIFTRELAIMIRSGLPLVKAMESLREQTTNKHFAQIIAKIATDIRGGDPLSMALSKHPSVFEPLYISVAKSGEQAGKLDETFMRLADQLDKDYALILRVRGAMIYPAFILATLALVVVLILIFVIPQLKNIFEEMGGKLPWATRFLIALSIFLKNYWWLLLIAIIGAIIGWRFFVKSMAGAIWWDKVKIRIPLFGSLFKKLYMARFARTTATLIAAGLPLLQTLKTLQDVIGNRYYAQNLVEIARKVESGYQLSAALKESPLFPTMVTNLVSVGEQSGNLDYALTNLADFFDREVDVVTHNLTTLIEPIMILIVGAGVAFVIASVLMPIYNLMSVM